MVIQGGVGEDCERSARVSADHWHVDCSLVAERVDRGVLPIETT